jgi:hypothetical protein
MKSELNMSIEELTVELERTIREYDDLASHRPSTLNDFRSADKLHIRIVALERELCRQKSVQFVEPIEGWQFKWTMSFTDVHLHSIEKRAWLFVPYYVLLPTESMVAQITFCSCVASRLVFIDYDELDSHSLFHCGLENLGAYLVQNSEWKREVGQNIERSIDLSTLNHYLFCFNSCLVEAIAERVDVVSLEGNVKDVVRTFFLAGQ